MERARTAPAAMPRSQSPQSPQGLPCPFPHLCRGSCEIFQPSDALSFEFWFVPGNNTNIESQRYTDVLQRCLYQRVSGIGAGGSDAGGVSTTGRAVIPGNRP